MPRPFQILQTPVFPPHVCIQCGVGAGRREWFVDLGFTIDQYFNVDNQAIYLCNECYNNMTLDVGRLIMQFRQDHERWDGGEKPSYTWMEQNVGRTNDSGQSDPGVGEDERVAESVDNGSDGNDQDTEPNDSEPESTDSGNADSTDDSNPDESAEGFRATFGSR